MPSAVAELIRRAPKRLALGRRQPEGIEVRLERLGQLELRDVARRLDAADGRRAGLRTVVLEARSRLRSSAGILLQLAEPVGVERRPSPTPTHGLTPGTQASAAGMRT